MLFVGADLSDARLVRKLLDASFGERFELEAVERLSAALKRLNRGDIGREFRVHDRKAAGLEARCHLGHAVAAAALRPVKRLIGCHDELRS